MTEAELVSYVQAHIGGEHKSKIVKPMIMAMAGLALVDLGKHLIDTDSELAKKFSKTASNQVWVNSAFSAPSDMMLHKQKLTTRIDFGGTLAYQIEDRDALSMITGQSNHYYALEGKTFYIKHSGGLTGSNNLNISYYKVPTLTEIDQEILNIFLSILIQRLMPAQLASEQK